MSKHAGAVIKIDVIISKVHSSDDVSLCSGSGISETFAGNMLFGAITGTRKRTLISYFSIVYERKKMSYAIIVIKHVFQIH